MSEEPVIKPLIDPKVKTEERSKRFQERILEETAWRLAQELRSRKK